MSAGPHSLVRERGATLVCGGADVCADLGLVPEPAHQSQPATRFDRLSDEQRLVRELLPARGVISTDELVVGSGLGVQRCLLVLQELAEFQMVAAAEEGGWVLRH